jgi:hypothetical protein
MTDVRMIDVGDKPITRRRARTGDPRQRISGEQRNPLSARSGKALPLERQNGEGLPLGSPNSSSEVSKTYGTTFASIDTRFSDLRAGTAKAVMCWQKERR